MPQADQRSRTPRALGPKKTGDISSVDKILSRPPVDPNAKIDRKVEVGKRLDDASEVKEEPNPLPSLKEAMAEAEQAKKVVHETPDTGGVALGSHRKVLARTVSGIKHSITELVQERKALQEELRQVAEELEIMEHAYTKLAGLSKK